MSGRLRWIDAPPPERVPAETTAFLRALGAPTAIRVAGADRSRCRVAIGLSHGNEPSGLRAVHAFLRSGATPAVDALLVVASVEAALREPLFTHRHLPGHRDLNRCFRGPFDGPEGVLAREILDAIERARPEAVVDLHNNSGHNPAYGVGPHAGPVEVAIARLFGERFVVTRLEIGALVEVVKHAPTLVVECGRGGDPEADAIAGRGLAQLLARERLEAPGAPRGGMQVLIDPVRVRLRPEVRLAVGEAPVADADFTLRADIDRHNFEDLPAGACLGWVRRGAPWPLEARGEDGKDRAPELFTLRGTTLETQATLLPVMMTTDPHMAAADCLFYAVRRAPERGSAGH